MPPVHGPEAKQFSSLPTAAGLMTRLACARAKKAGIELEPLLKRAGLTGAQIEDRSARVRVRDQIRFLELAAHELGDDLLGFHLARDFDLREMGLLYYVLASSDMLGDALRRAERYGSIGNEAVAIKCVEGKEIAVIFSYVGVARHSDRQQIEGFMTALIRTCRQLTRRDLQPVSVRFVHGRDAVSSEFNAFLGGVVVFGADVDEVVFPKAVKEMPVASADPYLNELLIAHCEEALSQRRAGGGELRSRVENAIAPLLPHGQAAADEVARRLGMSQRTLTRRLSSEGLTFIEVRDSLRADLARRYVRDADLPISKIAWLLGYQEVSAFTHAFKRWTGSTPRQMRTQADFAPP